MSGPEHEANDTNNKKYFVFCMKKKQCHLEGIYLLERTIYEPTVTCKRYKNETKLSEEDWMEKEAFTTIGEFEYCPRMPTAVKCSLCVNERLEIATSANEMFNSKNEVPSGQ